MNSSHLGRQLLLTVAAGLVVLAATTSLAHVFVDLGWLPLVWSAVGLALVVAAGGRALGFSAVAATVTSVIVWIVFTYITQLDSGGLLPGTEQWREFTSLWTDGFNALVREPTPARTLPGLLLLIATGSWLVTHTVHELLVRARRPGMAVTAAAVLWVFPLAPPQVPGETWPYVVPFLVAAGLLLLVEPGPGLAGRRTPRSRDQFAWLPRSGSGPQDDDDRNPSPAPLALRAGGVVGAVALALALVFPEVVPGYGSEPLVDLSGPNPARGYQPIVDVSERLKLPEERDLLRVEAERPMYLRLAGLETFDGNVWRLGPAGAASFAPDEVIPADQRLPPETPIAESVPVEVQIDNLSLENVFVPAPYQPIEVTGQAADRMVYSRDGTFLATSQLLEGEPALVPGLSYGVEALHPTPSTQDLRSISMGDYENADYTRWLELPVGYPELDTVVESVADEAGATSPYGIAFALQDYFRDLDRFTYSTDVPPLRGAGALTRFVTEDRVGYCEYFATAMAVMLRLEGIPSRVAVGFRTGEEVAEGEYVVTTKDAHAWVEVLFPGYGWIQFEPTPALGDAIVPTRDNVTPRVPVADAASVAGASPSPSASPSPDATSGFNNQQSGALDRVPEGQGATGADGRSGSGGLIALAVLAVLASLGTVTVASWRRSLHRDLPGDETGEALLAQRRLLDAARGLDAGRQQSESLREAVERWIGTDRVDAASARRFVDITQRAAFGGGPQPGQAAELDRLLSRLVGQLRASAPTSARLAAPIAGPVNHALDTARQLITTIRQATHRTASPSHH